MKELAELKPRSIRDYLKDYSLQFELPEIKICVMDSVYPPKYDSLLLAKQVAEVVKAGDILLDVGTGSGILALIAAARGAKATMTDIHKTSVECARYNAFLNNIAVDARIGNLFDPVRGESFDVIVSNMPSFPTPPNEQHDEYTTRNVDAGWDGRKYLDPLINQAPKYLKKPGYLLIVHSNFANNEKTEEKLRKLDFEVEIKQYEFPIGVNQIGLTAGQRIDYFLENLPQNCHPFKKRGQWYQRMDVFKACLNQ